MNQALNYVKTKELLGDNFSFYYAFNSYSGNAILGDASIETGAASPGLSGKVNTYAGFSLADFTGVSGSGNFGAGYIEIPGTETLNPPSLNILISQEKTGAGAATLISNIDEVGRSGYAVGVDDANHLYFKYYNEGTPNVFTYFQEENTNKNIYNISLNSSSFSFSRFDNETKAFTNQKTYWVNNAYYFRSPSTFKIGTGEYSYLGSMDEILLYTGGIGRDALAQLSNAFYQDYHTTPPITGYVTGTITGYSSGYFEATGVIGLTGVVSGYRYITGSITSVEGTGLLTGAGASGTNFYIPIPTGSGYFAGPWWGNSGYYASGLSISPPAHFYYESGFTGAGSITGITGFDYSSGTIYTTGDTLPIYSGSGITGVLSSGYNFTGLTGASGTYIISGAQEGISGTYPTSYFPIKMIYDGVRLTGDVLVEKRIYNNLNQYNLNQQFDLGPTMALDPIYSFGATGVLATGTTRMSINGQTQFEGSARLQNSIGNNFLVISGSYATTGDVLWGRTQFYTAAFSLNYMPVDALYDKGMTGKRGYLNITGTGQYASAPFSEIDIGGTEIYFNGVKLNSGINYINKAGGFQPSGAITGATGQYFYYKNQEDYYSATGSTYDFSGVHLNSASAIVYQNGVRGAEGSYYYGSSVDLIKSGRNSSLISEVDIFNNI